MEDGAAFLAIAGLDDLDEQIYLFVLARGSASPGQVVDRCEVDSADAARRLESLRDLGLISRAGPDDDTYRPVDPRFALSAIASRLGDRVARIRDNIPVLADQFAQSTAGGESATRTIVLTDRSQIASWYVRLQHQATSDFMVLDRPPYVSSPLEPLEAVVIGRGVRWRGLYTPESFSREGAWEETRRLAELGEESRIVPSLPVKLVVADRSIALVSLSLDGVRTDSLVTESPGLVESLIELFERRWDRGLPLFEQGSPREGALEEVLRERAVDQHGDGPASSSREAVRSATRDERTLLALIGAGLTDEAIAERLGISVRSLRRRSAKLMSELGAANRFQAGVEAARRGWV